MNIENSVIARQPLRATIITRKEIAKDTIELVLQPSARLAFTAGQYVWIILSRLLFADPKGRRRAFSIASPPQEEKLTFVYRTSPSGYKKTLAELPIGSDVEILGPFGFLTLPAAETPVVFLAGGTGMTPFLSIIGDLVNQKNLRDLYVLVSNLEEERVFYQEKLNDFISKNPQVRVSTKVGRLTWDDLKKCPTSESVSWYIAGPQAFVEGETKLLLEHGILPNQMHFDQFHGIVAVLPESIKSPSDLEVFKLAVLYASDHIIITDANGIIEYVNTAAEKITGFGRSELIGQTPRLWGGLMGKEFYQKLWQTIKYDRQPFRSDITNHRKNGEIYQAEVYIAPIIGGTDIVLGFVATERDITEERKVQQIIKASEERFRLLIEKSPDGITLTDANGVELYASPSVERILGYTPDELIGKPGFSFIHPEDQEAAQKVFAQVLDSPGASIKVSIRARHKIGKILWIEGIVTNLLHNEAVKAIVTNFRDVTHEKEIDRAKTEFISLASHQLRTPLSAVKWYSEMLIGGDAGQLNETQAKYLREVFSANERMIDLVNLLLDVSRMEMGKLPENPVLVNLPKLANEIIQENMNDITRKKLVVHTTFDPKTPDIMIDPKFIRIILQNLINNAVKYTPENGTISVNVEKKDGHISLVVQDTGIGIPKEDQERVFTKSFRANNAKLMDPYGTGVGLYLTKSIVDQLHGGIWFTSEEGKGTTVFAEIPITKEVKG